MSCTLQDAGEFVQALVGPAPFPTISECYREILSLCAEHRLQRALIVSSDGDATGHAAMSAALEAIAAARLAPRFKLAMVAEAPATFAVYQAAESAAARAGIEARAFRSRGEAVGWLTGAGSRSAGRSTR